VTSREARGRIDDRILIRGGKLLSGTSVAVALISMGILAVLGQWAVFIDGFVIHNALLAIGFGSLAWVTLATQARNGAVWTLAWAAFFGALFTAGAAIFVRWGQASIPEFSFEVASSLTASDLPLAIALASQPVNWAYIPAFMLVLTLGLLLFPDGRPPSPRWRWVGWYSVATIAAAVAPWVWLARPSSTVPLSSAAQPEAGTAGQLAEVFLLLALLGAVLSVTALVVRYRRSSGVTRHQIRWIAWGGTFLVTTLVVSSIVEGITAEPGPVSSYLTLAGEALLILSFAVAITKYRLYDIDVVISKTVTYGALAIVITALYVAIVVGASTALGRGDEPNLALAIAATAAVALLFEPIRSRLQRWANRLVFGERATPYEILARFSKRAASSEDDQEMLERIPRLIVDGTGASEATLWIVGEDGLQPAARWPERESASTPAPAVGDGPWTDPAADYSVAVEHDGELLGGLSLVASRGETIAPAEEELVQNLAGGLGLALRNARLTDDLRDQVGELAASRERILSAADEARRGLEQDLDMGPQQELVAVKVKLGVVKNQAEAANAPKTAEVLAQLEQDTGKAIESVRDFARGVYPPLLEAEGLAVAVSAEGAKSALPVVIQAGGVRRYPREVETAVFFSILESLQNAAKYSEAASATVTLDDDGDRLRFSVSDDGLGFDPAAVDGGSGIPGMADRLDAAGGTLKIESAPGSGTTVLGSVPT
jgi:signal transduction histidine kinase